MAGVTYKCPSCGAYLVFDPDSQQWKCPFCSSAFSQGDLLHKDAEVDQAAPQPAADGGQVVYHCPSCGSEIMTDETTAATRCYYCHSPVVLEGRLAAGMKPDSVLPFAIDKEKAVETFMNWVKGKRYVPKGFFSAAQVESMSGVYYPHFVTECELDACVDLDGRNNIKADTGRHIVTSTMHYHVRREGRIRFSNIMRPALSKANRKLSDGVQPFPLEKAKPFAGAYLSGFLAERRDMEPASIQDDVARETAGYVEPLLTESLHYNSYNVQSDAKVKKLTTRYVLLPTWVLTYPNKHDPQNPYYYAMNGCTGEVCGKLPIDKRKLYLTGGLVAAALFAAGCILSYFLF